MGASLLAMGVGGLWVTERTLHATADELLQAKAAAVQTEVDFERGRLVVDLGPAEGAKTATITAGLDVVRIWDRNGRSVYQLDRQVELPAFDRGRLQAILEGEAVSDLSTSTATSGQLVWLHTEQVIYRDRVVGAVQVGRSREDIEGVLGRLRWYGLGAMVVALTAAAAGGWFLASRALAPVARITRVAEEIGADDLSRRLNMALPDDELGRLSRAFDRMIDRLDHAFQRQRQFTADASHELRTPLAIIRSRAEVALGRQRDSDYYQRTIAAIRDETEQLGTLTESMLTLARADAGQPLAMGTVDVDELIADVAIRVAAPMHEAGLELVVQARGETRVQGDATLLGRVLKNLLDNARHHTPPGGRVTLRVTEVDGRVRIDVQDTGEGIAAEHLPHVFERFYRVDAARGRAAGRSGLGLAIGKWAAEAHGGRLTVESKVARGTTLSLWLPATASDAPIAGQPRLATPTTL
jgi:heavy metal sensor kinase